MAKPIVYITSEIPAEALAMIGEVAEIRQWLEEVAIPPEKLLEKVREIRDKIKAKAIKMLEETVV